MARIKYRAKRFRYESHWGFLVFAVAVVAATIIAGFWQLDRAAQKTAIRDSHRAAQQEPVARLESPLPPVDEWRFRRVRLEGRYLAGRQFLIDNRPRPGEGPGYEVVTPLELADGTVVPVNRGWLPAPVDRDELPAVPVDNDQRQVTGTLTRIEPGFTLGAMDVSTDWPRRVQFLDAEGIAERLDKPVYPGVLMLGPDQADGYRRDWTPVVEGPARHYAYALQWFAMALAAVIVYGFATIKRIRDD